MNRRDFLKTSVLASIAMLFPENAYAKGLEFYDIELDIDYDGHFKSYSEWIRRNNDALFVCTGTFFEVFSRHAGIPVGKIVKNGKVLNEGYDISNSASISYSPLKISEKPDGETQLGGLAWLVKSGKVYIPRRKIAPYDNRKRLAVGVKDNSLTIGLIYGTLYDIAYYMKDRGCIEAAALDGGGSAFLYANDRLYTTPERYLNNVLVGHKKPRKKYQRFEVIV